MKATELHQFNESHAAEFWCNGGLVNLCRKHSGDRGGGSCIVMEAIVR